MMILTAAFALAACAEEIEQPDNKDPEQEQPDQPVNPDEPKLDDEITLSASINNPATKASFVDNTIALAWAESGETFTASIAGTPVVFTQTTAPGADGKADFLGNPSDEATPESDLYAIYPAVQSTSLELDLSKQTGKELDAKFAYLYASGKVSDLLADGLVFNHVGASVNAVLSFVDHEGNALAAGTVKNLTLKAEGLVSKATLDLTDMTPALSATASGSLTLDGEFELDAEGKTEICLYVLPTTVGEITVTATIGEIAYTGTVQGAEIEAGQNYPIAATVQGAAPVVITDFYVTPAGTGSGASWAEAANLTAALEEAGAGSTLHLAAGTYAPEKALSYGEELTGDELKGFEVLKSMTIIGGYPANPTDGAVSAPAANETVLDGQGKSFHVLAIAAPKADGAVTLKGLTVTGGYAVKASAADLKHKVKNDNGEEVEITVNANHGAGIATMGSKLKMEDVILKGNVGYKAAAVYSEGTDLELLNCSIVNNLSNEVDGEDAPGIYVKATENFQLSVHIENSLFKDNDNPRNRNHGVLYMVADKGSYKDLVVKNTVFDHNISKNGAAIYTNSVENVMIANSTFKNHYSDGGAGTVYFECKTYKTNIFVTDCVFDSNSVDGNGTGITIQNCNGSQGVDAAIVNSAFINGDAAQRGTLFLRNQSKDDKAVNVKVVNCTFNGNTSGSVGGSAICMSEDNSPLNVDLISCTIYGNVSENASQHGAIYFDQSGKNGKKTLTVYNSIISGNTNTNELDGSNVDDIHINDEKSVPVYKSSIVGDKYYNAEGVETAVTPAFDFASMFSALAQVGDTWGCKLVGTAATNPAFGNGSTLAELAALADGTVTADILKKDQAGNARTDADKVIGAIVK